MQTSSKGIAFLESHEGVVLKAYRCPAGIWTIGSGLTAASGVVTPKAGMTITRGEASNLLQQALRRNYEPRVEKAMSGAKPHEFDGGVSFDFNTGAIHKASWVAAWKAGDRPGVARLLGQWIKGGGKVLPGLVRRRKEEADVINFNLWPTNLKVATTQAINGDAFARFVVSVAADEIAAIRDGLRTIGFDPGATSGKVSRSAVESFQAKYDLAVDGLIGRATLSTLQRELDARAKGGKAAVTAGGSGGLAAGNEAITPNTTGMTGVTVEPALVTWALSGIALIAAGYLLYLGWHYRDMIAARIAPALPRVARFLRSI